MTAFTLKCIAITAMLIDHMGAVFPEHFPVWFRVVGRLTFPLLVYLLAEGCRHTRSMPKFLLRLFVFALLSQIPFSMAFFPGPVSFVDRTNVFYSLFLGVAAVYVHQCLVKRIPRPAWLAWALSLVSLAAFMAVADGLRADYGGFGVAFIFTMYAIPAKKLRLAAMAVFCLYKYMNNPVMAAGMLASVPFLLLYNQQRGREMKWLFYVFYPLHLLVLVGVRLAI